jgi:perosamine synthetase
MRDRTPAILGGTPSVTIPWEQDWPYVGKEDVDTVVDLLHRRVLSIYDRSGIIAEFEDAFAAYHSHAGRTPYALSHNAGTSALHAAYFGLGLGPGDEVIVPTYTFLATVTPLLSVGASIVFADLDPTTLAADVESVRSRIGERTRAIVVTHMWGHPVDMPAICAAADERGVPVIEDCSHAHGATIDGRKVGTFGVAACFSLEGHKAVAAGEGGVLLTGSRAVYERALMLGHFGRRVKDEVTLPELRPYVETGFGYKYRMHPLAAGIALRQLERLDDRNAQRRRNLELLSELLDGVPGVDPPRTRAGYTRGGWYGYKPTYRPQELGGLPKKRFMAALRAEGVRVKEPGSPPLHRLPLFDIDAGQAARLGLPLGGAPARGRDECPMAEAIYPLLLSLPTFSGDDCEPVIRQYGEAFAKVAHAWPRLMS